MTTKTTKPAEQPKKPGIADEVQAILDAYRKLGPMGFIGGGPALVERMIGVIATMATRIDALEAANAPRK